MDTEAVGKNKLGQLGTAGSLSSTITALIPALVVTNKEISPQKDQPKRILKFLRLGAGWGEAITGGGRVAVELEVTGSLSTISQSVLRIFFTPSGWDKGNFPETLEFLVITHTVPTFTLISSKNTLLLNGG